MGISFAVCLLIGFLFVCSYLFGFFLLVVRLKEFVVYIFFLFFFFVVLNASFNCFKLKLLSTLINGIGISLS